MTKYSTRQAANKLGLGHSTLARYIESGKIAAPDSVVTGTTTTHIWKEEDIERVRKLLPKIKNCRKTRYTKKQLANSNWQLAKAKSKTKKQPQAGRPVPHKQRSKKK